MWEVSGACAIQFGRRNCSLNWPKALAILLNRLLLTYYLLAVFVISTNGWMDETYRSASSFKPKWPACETVPTITDVPKNCSILFFGFWKSSSNEILWGFRIWCTTYYLEFFSFLFSCNSLTNLPGGEVSWGVCLILSRPHIGGGALPYKPSAAEERTTVIIDLRSH